MPDIGIASFDAALAVNVSPQYAFFGPYHDGTDTAPFNVAGNKFLTNSGGNAAPLDTKDIVITFPSPVSEVSFYAAEIDSAPPGVVERLTSEIFDVGDNRSGQSRTQRRSYPTTDKGRWC